AARPHPASAPCPYTTLFRSAGGMGAVYGALDGADRHVAVKVVHPRHADDPAFREQFAREAELLARVDAECAPAFYGADPHAETRSEEHTSELQSRENLVCRL